MDYTLTLTPTEQKGMEYITSDVDGWITNVTTDRARIAILEIIEKLVVHCNANGIAMAVGQEAQVTQAYDLGVVLTAEAQNAASVAESPSLPE